MKYILKEIGAGIALLAMALGIVATVALPIGLWLCILKYLSH